jgi:hypothetical protein
VERVFEEGLDVGGCCVWVCVNSGIHCNELMELWSIHVWTDKSPLLVRTSMYEQLISRKEVGRGIKQPVQYSSLYKGTC